jgi:streptogramin lyase
VATLAARKIAAQGDIPVAFGHAWVLTGDGSTLVGIADDAVATTIDLGTVCTQVAASDAAIWAACPTEGVALKVDPVAGEVVARVPGLPNALAVAAGAQVWVGFDGGLARIDEERGEVTGTADAVGDSRSGIAVTPDAVWVHNPGLFLRRIDPATAAVVEDVVTPEEDGGSVLVAFGSVWATASDQNVLYRLDPA